MVVTVFLFRWPISFFLSQPLISRLYAHRHHPLSALLRHLPGSHAHMQAITTLKGFNQEAMTTLRDIVLFAHPNLLTPEISPPAGAIRLFRPVACSGLRKRHCRRNGEGSSKTAIFPYLCLSLRLLFAGTIALTKKSNAPRRNNLMM